jgi:hypothetical protein
MVSLADGFKETQAQSAAIHELDVTGKVIFRLEFNHGFHAHSLVPQKNVAHSQNQYPLICHYERLHFPRIKTKNRNPARQRQSQVPASNDSHKSGLRQL